MAADRAAASVAVPHHPATAEVRHAPSPVATDHPPDPELAAEQEHLAESRRQLARMRERTAALDSAAAGDWVSREYLESTFALRMKQLADDPTMPLFFGRLDYDATSTPRASTSAGGTSPTRPASRW